MPIDSMGHDVTGDGPTSGLYVTATATSLNSKTAREDYMQQRWSSRGLDALYSIRPFGGVEQTDGVPTYAVSRLPLPLQVAFRRKMLSIITLHLLAISAVVGLSRFHPTAIDLSRQVFQTPMITWALVALAAVGCVGLLLTLYIHRARFLLNWLLLLLFTGFESLGLVALGVALDSHVIAFNCGFTLACVVIMFVLSGLRRRPTVNDPQELLLSTFGAGVIAFTTIALGSCVLFLGSRAFDFPFLTSQAFGVSLGLQLVLVLWFALDVSCMYHFVTPDESMGGVVYFYADSLQLCVVVVVAMVTLVAFDQCDPNCIFCLWACCAESNWCERRRCCARDRLGHKHRDQHAIIHSCAMQRV